MLVGDVGSYLADAAKELDSTATLITQDNCTNIGAGTYYISLGDFKHLNKFIDTLAQAGTLIYQPPSKWSDVDDLGFSYMQEWTEFYLMFYQNRAEVLEINTLTPPDAVRMLDLADSRRGNDPQLWSVGCSITHGIGVEPEQRYGQLIADAINMPVSFLSATGSSIEWAADQILRSDIRANDIVVWGVTSYNRFPYYHTELSHVNTSYYQLHPKFNSVIDLDRLDEPNMQYRALTRIAEVVNFCEKIGAKIVIAGVLVDASFIRYVYKFPNYIQLLGNTGQNKSEMFIDLGTDNDHPGPATHKYYAEHIINKINAFKQ